MAVVPDPRKLFLPDEGAIPSVLSDKFFPIFSATLGFCSVLTVKFFSRRPLLSGIQHHILAAGGLGLVGKLLQDRYERYNMERDARYRHYIELHPEDFPMPERRKVGDCFNSWPPVR